MSEDMNEKYQKYHKEIINVALNDMLMKSFSYQANIKLANDIILDQEKQIEEWKSNSDSSKKELENKIQEWKSNSDSSKKELENKIEILQRENEELRNNKSNFENSKISNLENENSRLNSEILILNKIKKEYDLLKNQISNYETFRNELIKEREAHNQTKINFENIISDLKQKIDILQAPPKRKKPVKELTNTLDLAEIVQQSVSSDLIKDGGSF